MPDDDHNPYAAPASAAPPRPRIAWYLRLVPTLPWIFDRAPGRVTPGILKVCVVIQAFLLFGMNRPKGMLGENAIDTTIVLVTWLVGGLVFIGIWNLKRWAVLVLAAEVVWYVVAVAATRWGDVFPWRGVVLGVAVRGLSLVPARSFWGRMTWR